jgi:hypothetical protein
MGLMQLLVLGRSLKTAEDRRSPYRLTQQNLLPRFGSAGAISREEPAPSKRQVAGLEEARVPTVESSKPEREASMRHGTMSSSAKPIAAFGRKRFGTWLSRWRNPFRADSAAAKPERGVQGELLLQGVRVVRNDLNDADLEVVPVQKNGIGPATRLATEPAADEPSRQRIWPRITTRIFGSGPS